MRVSKRSFGICWLISNIVSHLMWGEHIWCCTKLRQEMPCPLGCSLGGSLLPVRMLMISSCWTFITEPSESVWAALVVMVPKKGGQWRFCVDYRHLNEVTRMDSYPIPRVDVSLDLVAGSSWITSLDLCTGYQQVPLVPNARPETVFCSSRGLWKFRVLCFVLCNVPTTFARLMDRVLSGIPRSKCPVYLDDILVHGRSFQASLEALRHVLGHVSGSSLKLHPEKCHFFRREVTFLWHKLRRQGSGTEQEAVSEWPTPTTSHQFKNSLGLAAYYGRFVQNFSTIADTEKNIVFHKVYCLKKYIKLLLQNVLHS